MRRERNRAALLSVGMTIILLLAVLIVISENSRKYADALSRASTAIARTNSAAQALLTASLRATALATRTRSPLPTMPPSASPPYDATLYTERHNQLLLLAGTSEPTALAQFMLTETALVARYQGTSIP